MTYHRGHLGLVLFPGFVALVAACHGFCLSERLLKWDMWLIAEWYVLAATVRFFLPLTMRKEARSRTVVCSLEVCEFC